MLNYTTMYCTILHCTILYYAILHHTILYYTIQCYPVLYCTCGTHECHGLPREEGVEHATRTARYYELYHTDVPVSDDVRQTSERYCGG